MNTCPRCGRELPPDSGECPSCNTTEKNPFTIQAFLWENFRLFTMVGVTATMISLIPNMGTRVLGMAWITDTDSLLPLFLSIIIFFGAIFLTICFFNIFSLVFRGRDAEPVGKKIRFRKRILITWYEGDFQRFVLLFCLVPMWFGMTMFFIMLMPQIPNKYSWLFAVVTMLICIPLLIFVSLGWSVGKTVTGKIPVLNRSPLRGLVVVSIIVIGSLLLLIAVPLFFDNPDIVSDDVQIRADQQYFSPHVSSAKGLRLEMTNLSGRQVLASRHIWSADYGYFIQIVPSTGDVTILGNPVSDTESRFMYWTFEENDPDAGKKPVTIDVRLYPLHEDREVANTSVYLTWYTSKIVHINSSYAPSH